METWEGANRVSINGSPNLANIRTIMIGIRNPKSTNNPQLDDGLAKSVEVWLNELRLSDFDEEGGWAANARIAARLADFGMLNIAGSTSRRGFGSIEKKVNERNKEDIHQYDISSNLELGKFFPEKAKISIPMYVGYSENFINPEYSPLDPDIPLDVVLEDIEERISADSARKYKKAAQEYVKRKSINFTNVKINNTSQKPNPFAIGNFAINAGYNSLESNDITTEVNQERSWNTGLMYNFNTNPKHISPFKKTKSKILRSPWLRLIKDFNFSYLPNQVSVRTDINRSYRETKLRDIAAADVNIEMPYTVKKDFAWNRVYNVKYDLTKALKIDYQATNQARIDEHSGRVYRDDTGRYIDYNDEDEYSYDEWRDSIVQSMFGRNHFGGRNTNFRQTINANYNIPINKIPLLSWITSTVRYSGNYEWITGPVDLEIGNTIKNNNTIQANGQVNFLNLYNKVPYLKNINQKYRRGRGSNKKRQKPKTEKVRWPEKGQPRDKIVLKSGKAKTINHKLETEDVQVKVFDNKGRPIRGTVKIINENKATFTTNKDYDDATVEVIGTKEIKESILQKIAEQSLRVIMGVKNISLTYSLTNGSMLPGYEPRSQFFGLQDFNGGFAPGLPYVLGYAEDDFGLEAGRNGWLNNNDSLSLYEPYTWNNNKNFNARSSIEPIPGMRVDLTASWTKSENLSYYIEMDDDGEFFTQSALQTGNFTMSFNTWGTAFKDLGKNGDYSSKAFTQFSENRLIVANRLADRHLQDSPDLYGAINPSEITDSTGFPEGYGPSSQQVMIPAFIAAYTDQSAEEIDLTAMPNIISKNNGKWRLNMMPNWRITYDGLKNIGFVKKYFKTITIGHAYRSSYSIGSYTTNSLYRDMAMADSINFALDQDLNFLPEYDINSISLNEQFSPLINIDMTWVNSLISKVEIKKSRNLAMSFSNNWMTETTSNEYVFGTGYRLKDVKIYINEKQYKSDVNIRADVSIRKNLTIIRKLEEEIDELTAGQDVITIKVSADYVLSDRFNLKIFYDRVVNKPKISLTYPRANTNFGVSVRFTLTQ